MIKAKVMKNKKNLKQSDFPFFDMHLHILPEVDDGADSIEESCRMIAMEWEQGVRFMCATPHFRMKEPLSREKVIEAYKKVNSVLEEKYPQMRLYLGQEIYYSRGIMDALDSKKALTINGSRYVLLEFSPDERYSIIFSALRELLQRGYIPILAHVERISALWKQWERMDELRSMYIPFQMNTSSLIGGSMNLEVRQCRRLVSEGYIDLLGTDAHGSHWRPPEYKAAADWIARDCGEETLRRMAVDNPVSILNGQLLQF